MKTSSSKGKPKKDFPITQQVQRAVPDVIVDFIFDAGCLFLSIQNIGTGVAHKVRIKFSERIYHIDGKTLLSSLPLFRSLEFLPPAKEIRTFVDTTASYFHRNQPENLMVDISCTDDGGQFHKRTIKHNLSIYKKIGFIVKAKNEER